MAKRWKSNQCEWHVNHFVCPRSTQPYFSNGVVEKLCWPAMARGTKLSENDHEREFSK